MGGIGDLRRLTLMLGAAACLGWVTATAAAGAAVTEPPPSGGPLTFTASTDTIGKVADGSVPVEVNLGAGFLRPGAEVDSRQAKELVFRFDRGLAVSVKGLPTCAVRIQIQAAGPSGLTERCKPAQVGGGVVRVSIPREEGTLVEEHGKALVFNGGTKDGTPRLWLYAELKTPVPNALIAPIDLRPIDQGALGEEAVVGLPPIASGRGSLTLLELHLGRRYLAKGERHSVLSLLCPARNEINFSAEVKFTDGTAARSSPMSEPCSRGSSPAPTGR